MPVDAAHEGITQLLRAEAEASEVVKTAKDGAPPPLAEAGHSGKVNKETDAELVAIKTQVQGLLAPRLASPRVPHHAPTRAAARPCWCSPAAARVGA